MSREANALAFVNLARRHLENGCCALADGDQQAGAIHLAAAAGVMDECIKLLAPHTPDVRCGEWPRPSRYTP